MVDVMEDPIDDIDHRHAKTGGPEVIAEEEKGDDRDRRQHSATGAIQAVHQLRSIRCKPRIVATHICRRSRLRPSTRANWRCIASMNWTQLPAGSQRASRRMQALSPGSNSTPGSALVVAMRSIRASQALNSSLA